MNIENYYTLKASLSNGGKVWQEKNSPQAAFRIERPDGSLCLLFGKQENFGRLFDEALTEANPGGEE